MMTQTGPEYLSVTDTAKLIRAQLKRQFPGVKFSVRSDKYAGGASIDIRWTDGPTEPQVDGLVSGYAGGRFDGMIDMASYVSSWLEEDGTAHTAHDAGTAGQRGSRDEYIGDPRTGGARLVHFGADHVFTRRELSESFVDHCMDLVSDNGRDDHGHPCPGCCHWVKGDAWVAQYVDLRGSERIDLMCSQRCAARRVAAHLTAEADS